jgi:hypothetical protein
MKPPFVLIELDKTRTLKLNTAAIMRAEEKLGIRIPQEFGGGTGELVILMWSALKEDTPAITISQVQGFFDEYGYETCANALGEAIQRAYTATKTEGDGEKNE